MHFRRILEARLSYEHPKKDSAKKQTKYPFSYKKKLKKHDY